ncbi:C39 family peptidase [Sporosarcina koreensis]|uniref:C39 family peptidase n=1 Tax=Sporosarcina koreensis TaxID=334735 RepID=UPI000757C9B8|nr:C39 family peptidase [Sporosarcina koreensis]
MEKGNYESKWDVLENYNLTSSNNVTADEKVLNVTRIWQRRTGVTHPDSACGPTSGAMVAEYLNGKGYNVKHGYHYGGDDKFINHLWSEMSWYWGATMGAYQSHMEKHLNLNYATQKFNIITWDTNDFNTYKRFINEGLPVTIRFNNVSQGNYWAGWHFVVGNAYKVTTLGNFVGVKDPDNGQNNIGTNYFAWDPNYKVITLSQISVY